MGGRRDIRAARRWQVIAPRVLVLHRWASLAVIGGIAALAVANCLPAIKRHFAAGRAVGAFCHAPAIRGAVAGDMPFDGLLQPLTGRFEYRLPLSGGRDGTF